MALTPPGRLEWRTGCGEQGHDCGSAERGLFTIRSPVWWRQAQEADAVFASLDPAFVGRIARGILDVDPQKFTRTLPLSDAGIESILLALRAELIDGCPGGRYDGESLATALAARLLWFSGKTSRSSRIGGLMPGRLRRILDYIDANLASDTTVERLAAHSKTGSRDSSRAFFCKIWASHRTSTSPKVYQTRQRTCCETASSPWLRSVISLVFPLRLTLQPPFENGSASLQALSAKSEAQREYSLDAFLAGLRNRCPESEDPDPGCGPECTCRRPPEGPNSVSLLAWAAKHERQAMADAGYVHVTMDEHAS